MIVRMWELTAHPEAYDEVLSWACEVAAPELEGRRGCERVEVLTGTDRRVVVMGVWARDPADPAPPPGHLVAAGPRGHDFFLVDR